jgi:hypothetical protein
MWTTQQESNASHFIIERSSVANSATTDMEIGSVAATNTSTPHNYTFIDQYPLNGTNYYRLRMVDFDNRIDYSPYRYMSCSGCTVTPPQLNCAGYSITGPALLCSGAATYQLNPAMYYTTYNWSISNTVAVPDNFHKPTMTLTQSMSGLLDISLALSRCTSNTNNKVKGISVGKVVSGYFSGPSSQGDLIEDGTGTNYGTEGYYTVHISNPANYTPTWTYLTGTVSTWYVNAWNELVFYLPASGDAMFQLDINTDCGPATYYYDFVENGGFGYYTLSPNPASSQINLYVDDRKLSRMKTGRAADQNIQQVIISDKTGNTVLQQRFPANTRNASLNISSLKLDMYTIRVFNGKKWTAMKFIKR